jgi:hypothetical protein
VSEVHLELLVGRRVKGRDGRPVGRLEEVRAERQGEECVVSEYLIGPAALLERLAAPILRLLGRTGRSYAASWDQVDLSDPRTPRLTCGLDQLRTLRGPRPKEKTEAEKERAEERKQRAAEMRKRDEQQPKEQPEKRHEKEEQERRKQKGGKG